MNFMKKNLQFIILLVVLFGLLMIGKNFYAVKEETSLAMGTIVTVKGNCASVAIAEIKRLDQLFSKFDSSSEVSRINAAAGRSPVKVSDDTFNAIAQALWVSKLSGGAFDITLRRNGSWQDVLLNRTKNSVFLKKAGIEIDLGGIGKGCAVQSARELLRSLGVKKALIDMRSSIAAIGGPWKIGLQDPQRSGAMMGVITLNDGDALSTSGQYEQPGHIINPLNGKVANQCISVTIVAKDASLADALSTAVFVLGPDRGMKLIRSLPDTECLIIDSKGKLIPSSGFKHFIALTN
jgi:thiamine biosynthesis lipoprotein